MNGNTLPHAPSAGRLFFLATIWLLFGKSVSDESVGNTIANRRKIRIDRKRALFEPFEIHLFPQCQSFSRTDMDKFFQTVRQSISTFIQSRTDQDHKGLEFRYAGLTNVQELSITDDCHASFEVGKGAVNFLVSADSELPSESQISEWAQSALQENLLKALQRTKEFKYISHAGLDSARTELDEKRDEIPSTTCTVDIDGPELTIATVPVRTVNTIPMSNKTDMACTAPE